MSENNTDNKPSTTSNKKPRKRGRRKKKPGQGQNKQGEASAINHSSRPNRGQQGRGRKPSSSRGGKRPDNKTTKKESTLNKPKIPTEDFSIYTAPTPKNYQLKMFDSFNEAYANLSSLGELAESCDQLNVVIKAEGNMEDPQILEASPKIKLFAGEAWFLIHTRRVEEDWYSSQH